MNWKMVYQIRPTHKMSWYYPSLDPDLEKALKYYKSQGGSFLDIGTGGGTQAVELSKRGFSVTGTDISGTAIKKASRTSNGVRFLQDDIMNTVKHLAEHLRPFFWDTDLSKINTDKNKQFIIERILELGDAKAIQWLFSNFSQDDIKIALKKSKRISKKSLNFWSIVLEDHSDV